MLNCNCKKRKGDDAMKYDCAKEFDLNDIYRKLTSPSQPQMVKASEFFTPIITLEEFQHKMELVMRLRKQPTK